MARYHISPKTGDPAPCKAGKKPCPLRNPETGEPEQHFSTKEEAGEEATRRMNSKHPLIKTMKKSEEPVGAPAPYFLRNAQGRMVRFTQDSQGVYHREESVVLQEERSSADTPFKSIQEEEELLANLRKKEQGRVEVEITYASTPEGGQERVTRYKTWRETPLEGQVPPAVEERSYTLSSSEETREAASFTEGRKAVAEHYRGLGFEPDENAYHLAMGTSTPEELRQVTDYLSSKYPLNDELILS